MTAAQVEISRLGQRGEGVARGPVGPVFIPYALPGDSVLADLDGDKGRVLEVTAPSPDRVPAICPYFGTCGGCVVQSFAPHPYAAWKRDLVVAALAKAGIAGEVLPLRDAHGHGRRRATIHARSEASHGATLSKRPRVGFMRSRAHDVVDLQFCPILAPGLDRALPAARALAAALAPLAKPLDLVITETEAGMDVDLRGLGPLSASTVRLLTGCAAELDLARLANHGDVVVQRRAPTVRMGWAHVALPPGAFLQATKLGEQALADLVLAAAGSARKVADLFSGLGPLSLRLAERATVAAFDIEGPALAALSQAARATPDLRPIVTEARDLFRRPLLPAELARFDAVVFDPPRAGAAEQAAALARSTVPLVIAVSCNPATFARDAAVLTGGGYEMAPVAPVDQFRYSAHVELVAAFSRRKPRRTRALFG